MNREKLLKEKERVLKNIENRKRRVAVIDELVKELENKMHRKILFRGKRADNGEWIYGYPFVDYDETISIVNKPNDEHEDVFYLEVIPETIGQYTGLTDKNGKKIFEGDKVMRDNNWTKPTEIGVVTWNKDNASFQIKGHIPSSSMKHLNRMKLIGNIHDGGN